MKTLFLVLLLSLAFCIISVCRGTSSSWWSVAVTGCATRRNDDECPNCAKFGSQSVFDSAQESQCRDEPRAIEAIAQGMRHSIVDCQVRFNHSRWNCSTFYGSDLFGYFVAHTNARETAVLTAYFAAGAALGIAEDCHEERLQNCPCVRPVLQEETDEGVKFFACPANLEYGKEFLSSFLMLDNTTLPGKITKHNVDVGTLIVDSTMESCRCHGISGTCSIQTCYQRNPTIEEVGQVFFQRYGGAIRVQNSTRDLENFIAGANPPGNNDLVYSDKSPNFCLQNLTVGTSGVAGRPCDPNPNAINACNFLCCDFGYSTTTSMEPIEVCRFDCYPGGTCGQACCYEIRCMNTGTKTITKHFCNGPQTDRSSQ